MTMFASVLHLDRKAVKALRITDLYSLHRVVYSLYEDVRDAEAKAGSEPSGILFADQGGDQAGRRVLLLSDRQPREVVEGQYGQVQSKPIPDNFLDHSQYRFKVIINPTLRDNASRKLVPVRGRDNIGRWFTERGSRSWGFALSPENLQVNQIEVRQFKDKHQRQVTIAQAEVQGVLRITDKERFCNSFTQGIGRARAFGCGLLQIVPLVDNPFA